VSSTAIVKPALASNNDDNHNNGNSVSKSDIRDVGKFLKCIADNGGNDISKRKLKSALIITWPNNNNSSKSIITTTELLALQ
jgi:hypothetical protein